MYKVVLKQYTHCSSDNEIIILQYKGFIKVYIYREKMIENMKMMNII